MKDSIKNIYVSVMRVIVKPFFLLPLKSNRIVLCSYSGQSFSCNPKYVYEKLKERFPGEFCYVWGFKKPSDWSDLSSEDTVVCRYRSLRWVFYRLTSKFYIANAIEGTELPKRRNQVKIQTWHGGGCYKRVIQAEGSRASKALKQREKRNIDDTDVFISSSAFFSENVIKTDFSFHGVTLDIGMPRNDLLVTRGDEYNRIRSLTRKRLGIDDYTVVLYAPTWRYDRAQSFSDVNMSEVKDAAKRRFGKECVILYRAHVHMEYDNQMDMRDVSSYPDMQELLAAADILLTDYSSSIWDFSLSGKPSFLFVPDLKTYEEERSFWKPIRTWGFPVCQTMSELVEAIRSYNAESDKEAILRHHRSLGSYESGEAAEKLAEYIKSQLD